MITIESTPEFVSSVYARMDRTLEVVRRNLGRPLGLAGKIRLSHLDEPATSGMERGKTYVHLLPHPVVLPALPGQTAQLQAIQTRPPPTAVTAPIHAAPHLPAAACA